jgi:hypothetical protein
MKKQEMNLSDLGEALVKDRNKARRQEPPKGGRRSNEEIKADADKDFKSLMERLQPEK